jgi:hypothetical protein
MWCASRSPVVADDDVLLGERGVGLGRGVGPGLAVPGGRRSRARAVREQTPAWGWSAGGLGTGMLNGWVGNTCGTCGYST